MAGGNAATVEEHGLLAGSTVLEPGAVSLVRTMNGALMADAPATGRDDPARWSACGPGARRWSRI